MSKEKAIFHPDVVTGYTETDCTLEVQWCRQQAENAMAWASHFCQVTGDSESELTLAREIYRDILRETLRRNPAK